MILRSICSTDDLFALILGDMLEAAGLKAVKKDNHHQHA
jgi:hypothetical protein